MSENRMLEGRYLLPLGRVVPAGDRTWHGRPAFERPACPACGPAYRYTREPQSAAGRGGRGDLLVIPMEGECGRRWEMRFGFHNFHEGETFAFVRTPRGAGEEGGAA